MPSRRRAIVHGGRALPPANVASRIREAFRATQQERPGAAHIELPEDIAAEAVPNDFLFPTDKIRRPSADEKAVRLATVAIQRAQRPLILIGAGANRSQTSKALQGFVDKTQIPFFTTQMGKGVLDERQALCLGTAALSEHDVLNDAVAQADLIVNVGHDVVENPPFFMRPGGVEVIHVNYSPAEVDPVYFPRYQVVGDVANAMWQLTRGIERQEHWDEQCFVD